MNQSTSPAISDQMLKSYIDQIFNKFDTDRNGTLDAAEMTCFFNYLFKSLNMPLVVTQQQAVQAIKMMDSNYDGKIDKYQLFVAFKMMLNQPKIQQPVQYSGYNGGNGYMNPNVNYNNAYGRPYYPQPNIYYPPTQPNNFGASYPNQGFQGQGGMMYGNNMMPQMQNYGNGYGFQQGFQPASYQQYPQTNPYGFNGQPPFNQFR